VQIARDAIGNLFNFASSIKANKQEGFDISDADKIITSLKMAKIELHKVEEIIQKWGF
jgi:hypothetical protein